MTWNAYNKSRLLLFIVWLLFLLLAAVVMMMDTNIFVAADVHTCRTVAVNWVFSRARVR